MSNQALYHAIPQAPLASNPVRLPQAEQDDDEDIQDELVIAAVPDARIRWIHFMLGCAVLLPWNALITATPYFISRLSESPLRTAFSSYLSTSFTASNVFILAYATYKSKQASSSRWITWSSLSLSALTLLLTLSTFTHPPPSFFFAFVLLNGLGQACGGAYLQTAVIAVASLFGPTAIQAVMSGQAAVGIAVSAVQLLSATASLWRQTPESETSFEKVGAAEEKSAFIFFALSTVFFIATAAAQRWLTSMPIYKLIVVPHEQRKLLGGDEDEDGRQGSVSTGRDVDAQGRILRVARANIIYEIAVAYVFVVTLAVYPPITISVMSTNPATHPLIFSSLHFLFFNVGDFTGRYLCSYPRLLIWSSRKLLTLSLARTLFIPLFLMCNVQRPASGIVSTPIINSDFLYILILLAFGLSNGYLSSLCMMSAPSLEHNPRLNGRREDVDVAATVASFCLVGGLAVGSMASFGVRAAVCNCNPFTE